MSRDDVRKLLGGYATGTLTPEEQEALFAAALEDQGLFDELAREQSLRDLLRDPAARAQVASALGERPAPWYARWTWRPAAAAAAFAAIVVAIVVVQPGTRPSRLVETAQVKLPAPAPAPAAEAPGPTSANPAAEPVAPAAKTQATLTRRPPDRRETRASRPPAEPQPPRRADAPPLPPPPVEPAEAPQAEAPKPAVARPPAASPQPRDREAPGRPALSDTVQVVPSQAVPVIPGQNVRDLFYGNVLVSSFAESEEKSVTDKKAKKESNAAPRIMSATGALAGAVAGAPRSSQPAGAADSRASRVPGVKYTILRRNPAGDFVETAPDDLKTGDSVKLRFETNDAGYLTVFASTGTAGRTLFSRRMERMAPFTTEALGPGETRLQVAFARQAAAADAAQVTRLNLTQEAAAERTTYVVGQPASSQYVNFNIVLNFK